jgi:hypothetical protein
MATKSKSTNSNVKVIKSKKKRKGIVSKNNTSNQVQSKNYSKPYRGQGR